MKSKKKTTATSNAHTAISEKKADAPVAVSQPFFSRSVFGSQYSCTFDWTCFKPGSLQALCAPSLVTDCLLRPPLSSAVAKAHQECSLPESESQCECKLEHFSAMDCTSSNDMVMFAHIRINEHLQEHLPSLWARLIRSILYLARVARGSEEDHVAHVVVQALQHVDAWSDYLTSVTRPKADQATGSFSRTTLSPFVIRSLNFDIEKCLSKSTRSQLNVPSCNADSATISYGPVNIFTDAVIDLNSDDTLIAHVSFIKTGSNDAWSVGLLPLDKENDKRHTLCCPTAIARAHRAGYGVPHCIMPTGQIITTWVNVKERSWNICTPGEQLVTMSIPEAEFPLMLVFNGGCDVTITLIPEHAPLPAELSAEIQALASSSKSSQVLKGNDAERYRLCVDDIHGRNPLHIFELLKDGFPQPFLSAHFETLVLALHLHGSNKHDVSSETPCETASGRNDLVSSSGPVLQLDPDWRIPKSQMKSQKRNDKRLLQQVLSDKTAKSLALLPDLSEACWTMASVLLPVHGDFIINTIPLHCSTSCFELFFPRTIYGDFDGVDIYAAPQQLLSQPASTHMFFDEKIRVQSPSLNAMLFRNAIGCTTVTVLQRLEDAELAVNENTLHILLHPDTPQSVICSCIRHLIRQCTAFARQDEAAVALFRAATTPLVQLIRFICCQKDDIALKPGRCFRICSGKKNFANIEGATVILCRIIAGNKCICSISSDAESDVSCARQYVTVPSHYLQFSSASHDVWREILSLIRECTLHTPSYMICSGIAEILFEDVNLGSAPSEIEKGLYQCRVALGRACCAIPSEPNDPVDIASGAENNWPPILNSIIMALCKNRKKKKRPSLKLIFLHVLRGQKHFELINSGNSAISRGKCTLLFESMCNHFLKHWDSPMYLKFVLEAIPTLFNAAETKQSAISFPVPILAPFTRCLIKLVLCGRLPVCVDYMSFFTYFFDRNDVKLGFCEQESDSLSDILLAATFQLFSGFKKLLESAEPYLEGLGKLRGFHVVPVQRDIFRLIRCSWGDVAFPFVLDNSQVKASLLYGWCSFKYYDDIKILPIAHSVIIAALLNPAVGNSISDISRHTRIESSVIEDCLSHLMKSGYVFRSASQESSYTISEGFSSAIAKLSSKEKSKPTRAHPESASTQQALTAPDRDSLVHFFSGGDNYFEHAAANISMFIRIVHCVFAILLGQYKECAVSPFFEDDLIMHACDSLGVSIKDVKSVLLYLETKNIIRSATSSHRHFVFCCEDFKPPIAEAIQAAKQPDLPAKTALDASDSVNMMAETCVWKKHNQDVSIIESAILYVPVGDDVLEPDERTGCVEFSDKHAAQKYFGEMISQLHNTLQVPFFIAARELTCCHGDVCRVILKEMDVTMHDAVFGRLCAASVRPAVEQPHSAEALKSPVCTVCCDAGDEDASLIRLPCGDCMCEDCFASRFLNESGALPECETPCAQDGDTPKAVADYFTCPSCNQELLPSFWESFPQFFEHAQQSPYCKLELTLVDVQTRIVASVLRKLRCDPLAAVACCPESLQSAGRYAIAFDVNHEVTCFGRTFTNIICARIATSDLSLQNYGLSEAESDKWTKVQQDLRTFAYRSKKLNIAGNRMRLCGPHYYCGKSMPSQSNGGIVDMRSVEVICGPNVRQCQDCLAAEAELAHDIKPEIMKEAIEKKT